MPNLELTIIRIRKKIDADRELYRKNEQSVRKNLIEPILDSIGWKTNEPKYVIPNQTIDKNVPDYTLKSRDTPILYVEAKDMDTNISKNENLQQIGKYGWNEGHQFGVITNGSRWILFKTFVEKTKLNERILWDMDLENDDIELILAQFDTICRKNIHKDIEKSAKEIQKKKNSQEKKRIKQNQIMEETWQNFTANSDQIIQEVIPLYRKQAKTGILSQNKITDYQISEFLKEKFSRLFINASQPESKHETGENLQSQNKVPERMWINEEVFRLTKSNDILPYVANWLIKNKRIKESDIPFGVTRGSRYLINKTAVHRDNQDFNNPKPLDNKYYIETHASTRDTKKYATKLFKTFADPKDTIRFE